MIVAGREFARGVLSPVSPFGTAFNPSVSGSLNTGGHIIINPM
jgi:hypothetical protein